jgi:hypothetical protein
LGWCMCVLLRSGGDFVDEPAGDVGIQEGLAGGYRVDRVDDLRGWHF